MAQVWTLRRRIGIGYVILLLLAVISAIGANVAFQSVVASQDQVSARYGRTLVQSERLRSASETAISSAEAYALSQDPAPLAELRAAHERFDRTLRALQGALTTAQERSLLASVVTAHAHERQILDELVQARRGGPVDLSELHQRMWRARAELEGPLATLTRLERDSLAEARRHSLDSARRARELLTLLAGVGLAVAALGAILYTRALAMRIERDQEKQHLSLLLDGVRDYAIVQLDGTGKVETWNAGAEGLFGFSAEEMKGQGLDRLYEDATPEKTRERLERAVRQGRLEEGTWRPRKDGSRFFGSGLLAPLWGPRGEVRAFAFICRDVTVHRQAEEERTELLMRERKARHELRGALRALQKSERRERRLADSNLIGVFFFDLKGGIVEANDAFLQLIGGTDATFPLSWAALVPHEEREAYGAALKQLETSGVCAPYETLLLEKGVGKVPVLLGAALLEGSETEGVAFVLDVRERKRAEEALRFLAEASTTLASSLDYATTLARVARLAVPKLADWCMVELEDPDGRLRRVAVVHRDAEKDELAQELLGPLGTPGVPRPPVLGLAEPELVADMDALMQEVAAGPTEHEVVRELGFNSAMVVPLVVRHRALGAILLVSSGERHYGEADLALADDLARRCAAAVDNARLYQEAQDAIRVRDEFLSIASHELKTPLTSLRLLVESLRRLGARGVRLDGEEAEQRLGAIDKQAVRLANLSEELLDISRIRLGRMDLKLDAFDLAEVVREHVERFGEQARTVGSRIELSAGGPIPGRWDRTRVEQILTNLLSNAVKYGAGDRIEVGVSARDGVVTLRVADHGIGIEPEQQARIFERFERAVSARHFGGLGLGLYIVRQIVTAHGGEIQVESRPGEGSTFTVTLPQWSVSAEQAPQLH